MSAASETLARDNCTVSDEIVQLREDKASHTHNMNALQVRPFCKTTLLLPVLHVLLCTISDLCNSLLVCAASRLLCILPKYMTACLHAVVFHAAKTLSAGMLDDICRRCFFCKDVVVLNCQAMQDRVAKLQELYMRDLDQCKAITTVHEDMQQSNLLQLATPEILAVSTPPAEFPLPSTTKLMRILPALHEIEALRRERDALQGQVCVHQPCMRVAQQRS